MSKTARELNTVSVSINTPKRAPVAVHDKRNVRDEERERQERSDELQHDQTISALDMRGASADSA